MKRPGSATIKDVASVAGVSTATVSNVLRGKDQLFGVVAAEKVRKAVRELDYRPNL